MKLTHTHTDYMLYFLVVCSSNELSLDYFTLDRIEIRLTQIILNLPRHSTCTIQMQYKLSRNCYKWGGVSTKLMHKHASVSTYKSLSVHKT